jgi:hypothetical protein
MLKHSYGSQTAGISAVASNSFLTMAEVSITTAQVLFSTLGGEVHNLIVSRSINGKGLKRIVARVLDHDHRKLELVVLSGVSGRTLTISPNEKPLERCEGHAHLQVVVRKYHECEALRMDAALSAIALARCSVGMSVELVASLNSSAEYLDLGTREGAVSACGAISCVLGECIVEHIGAVRRAETRARDILYLRCLGALATDWHGFQANVVNAFGRPLLRHEHMQMHEAYVLLSLDMRPIFVRDIGQLLPVVIDGGDTFWMSVG